MVQKLMSNLRLVKARTSNSNYPLKTAITTGSFWLFDNIEKALWQIPWVTNLVRFAWEYQSTLLFDYDN
jgi:hypothetical protein